jgi:xanthine dehydrogenase accessory factor
MSTPFGPATPLGDGELFAECARRSDAREPYALCTVASTDRSAPRDPGAKMLVAPDGSIRGTVGGGPLEAAVIADARALLASGGASRLLRFSLTTRGDSADPLPPDAAPEPDLLGMKCGGEVSVLVDIVRPAARLLLFGAGHVGERVATLAGEVGFDFVVIDDRGAFVDPARFPRASQVLCRDLQAEPLAGLSPGPEDFVVILTRCHALDEGILEAALQTRARYVGLIGSRRKVALLLRSISSRTGTDHRNDPRLHAPIGLNLGDKTPGEIAVSILAELILIKSQGQLAHNRLPNTARAGAESDQKAS